MQLGDLVAEELAVGPTIGAVEPADAPGARMVTPSKVA
jgi:hypothetical protein